MKMNRTNKILVSYAALVVALIAAPVVASTVSIRYGGTGQQTADSALNALLPSQSTHNGKFLQTNGSTTSWVSSAASPLTTKGDLWGFSTVDARVPVGTNNYLLAADSTQANGVAWKSLGTVSGYTAKGQVLAGSGSGTSSLTASPGDNNYIITSDTAQTNGIKWQALSKTQLDAAASNGSNVSIGGFSTTFALGAGLVSVGFHAGRLSTASATYNTSVGYYAGEKITYAGRNTSYGANALASHTYTNSNLPYDTKNTAVGYFALYTLNSTSTSDGLSNTALGYFAGRLATTGSYNTWVGDSAGTNFTTGNYNTALGYNSGPTGSNPTISGTVAIGADSSGNAAQPAASNDFILGTSNHNVKVAGTFTLSSGAPGVGKVLTSDANGQGTWAASGGRFAGEIVTFAGTNCPSGTIAADGLTFSSVTYPNLATALGDTYGAHSGTTYYTPNAKGVFLRGAGSQTISSILHTGTQGMTENDQFQGHRHAQIDPSRYATALGGALSGFTGNGTVSTYQLTILDPSDDGTNGTPRTGTETRPANISVLYCLIAF